MGFRVYLRLGRVSNLPTVWTNCLAAVVLAGGKPDAFSFPLVVASMSVLYIGGMFLNDAFDQQFDRKYRPERPIPSGEISGAAVYAIGFGLLAVGLTLLSLTNKTLVWGGALAGLIVYYDWRHKVDPVSPLIMALCRAMVYFAAAAIVSSALTAPVIGGASVLTAYLVGLTYVAKQENLTKIKNLWPLALLVAPFVYAIQILMRFDLSSLLYLAFLGWVIDSLSHLFSSRRKSIPRAVVGLIAGISLLDATLITSVPEYAWLSWLGLAGFILTLLFQRYIPGT